MYTKGEWKAREIPAGGWIVESNLPAPVDLFELPARPRVFMSFTDDDKIACDITYERCGMFPNSFQGNQEANAYLIAAAPNMYEALKVSLAMNGCHNDEEAKLFDIQRQALAKAEGK